MKPMDTIEDLIEEAKVRTVWWALCIFFVTYFLSHTSSSMWINLPVSILIVAALRILSNEVDFYWKPRNLVRPQSYLSHLEKKQLSVNDSRLSSAPPPPRWRRKIDSPVVEASVNDFIDKIMKDFVVDLWYSEITPDKDAPELIRGVIMDALGEISGRVKEINVVDLLTRYINEVIEIILLAVIDNNPMNMGNQATGFANSGKSSSLDPASVMTPTKSGTHEDTSMDDNVDHPDSPPHAAWGKMLEAATQRRTEVLTPENLENMWTKGSNYKRKENKIAKGGSMQAKPKRYSMTNAEFSLNMGKEMEVSSIVVPTRTDGQVADHLIPQLSPDNSIVNEKRNQKNLIAGQSSEFSLGVDTIDEFGTSKPFMNGSVGKLKRSNSTSVLKDQPEKKTTLEGECGGSVILEYYNADFVGHASDPDVKIIPDIVSRSDATNVPKLRSRVMGAYFEKNGSKSFAVYSIAVTDAEQRTWFVKRRYSNFERLHRQLKDIPNYTLHLPPKRIFSSSTEDAFVHQRCIQLDKYLQDLLSIANVAEQHEVWDFLSASSKNYSFGRSSSVMKTLAVNVDDAVDDIMRQFKGVSAWRRKASGSASQFDETSSPSYSRISAWNVDDSNKTVCRQDTMGTENSSSDNDESHQQENPDQEDVGSGAQASGSHSDNEVESRTPPGQMVKQDEMSKSLNLKQTDDLLMKSDGSNEGRPSTVNSVVTTSRVEDPVGMPPEWTPPNVSVPLLNLVDKVFQLKRRGWLRRQVFWISKQIVQLMMEDAIDDWLLGQIYWLRREETIALGIRWVQDFLWPNGTFFTRIGVPHSKGDESQQMNSFQLSQFGGSKGPKQASFEEQLEASRRANYIRKTLFGKSNKFLMQLNLNRTESIPAYLKTDWKVLATNICIDPGI
ncbi:Sorting nexin-16 [Linum perenne]